MSTGINATLFYGFIEPENYQWEYWYDEMMHNRRWPEHNVDVGAMGYQPPYDGGGKCATFYIAHKDAHHQTMDGFPLEIDGTKLEIKPDWDTDLRSFVKDAGIDLGDQQAKWYIVPYYG
jgi:hypothetical protein